MAKSTTAKPSFKEVLISDISANPNNPRTISEGNYQKLVNSIKSFPEMLRLRPIVVDANYMVLGGNMRLKAAEAAGLIKVPVILADSLTEAQKTEFIIKDNVSFGQWDFDILANDWPAETLDEWGVSVWVDESSDLSEPGDKEAQPEKPQLTDDGYSLFELVMVHSNKVTFVDVLHDIKSRYGFLKQEEAIMKLCEIYKNSIQ